MRVSRPPCRQVVSVAHRESHTEPRRQSRRNGRGPLIKSLGRANTDRTSSSTGSDSSKLRSRCF